MNRTLIGLLISTVFMATATGTARAGDDSPMTFELDKERNTRQKILIASLAGGAVVVAGIGLLFHLDSKEKSDAVSASGRHTGLSYTEDIDDIRRAALRARNLTIASYGVVGGLLIASFVVYLITDPGTETLTLGEDRTVALPPVTLDPVVGGAILGGRWSF